MSCSDVLRIEGSRHEYRYKATHLLDLRRLEAGNPSEDVVTTTLPEGLRNPTEAELETDWYAFSSMPKFVYRGEISQEALAEGTALGDMCGELIGVIG